MADGGVASRRERVRALAGPIVARGATPLALLFLQLATAMYYWLPEMGGRGLLAPTWELGGLLVLTVLLGWRRWPRKLEIAQRVALGVLVLLLLVLGFGQGLARHEFGYDVVLSIDLKYVPVLFGMMFRADSLPRAIATCVLVVLLIASLLAGIYLSLRRIQRVAGEPALRKRHLGGVAAALVVCGLVFGVHGPLTRIALEQLDMAVHKQERAHFVAKQMELEVAQNRGLGWKPGSWKPSVLIFVVESYGEAMLVQDQFSDFRAWLTQETAGLTASGYAIRSHYLVSPVFGGSSWMADATLLCGVKVNNQQRYEALKQARLSCLPEILNRGGWETVFAAGNTTFVDATFRRLFPFTRMLLKDDIGYGGPRYAWSFIPDQFVIDRVQREVMARHTATSLPEFVLYMLTSSHHPWSKIPPYINNWDDLGDGRIFNQVAGQEFLGNRFLSGTSYARGFDASIRYALHTVFEYIKTLPAGEPAPLIIILGDHQPRHPISEMKQDNWWVPLYVVSRDPRAVDRFTEFGYIPGVVPSHAVGALPLERFGDQLLKVLGD
jgi:hypothetical protein